MAKYGKKILVLAKVMVDGRSALICNSIARATFNHDYFKILFFELQNESSPTLFEQSHLYLAVMFSGHIKRERPN
jgi:hypothetical protein